MAAQEEGGAAGLGFSGSITVPEAGPVAAEGSSIASDILASARQEAEQTLERHGIDPGDDPWETMSSQSPTIKKEAMANIQEALSSVSKSTRDISDAQVTLEEEFRFVLLPKVEETAGRDIDAMWSELRRSDLDGLPEEQAEAINESRGSAEDILQMLDDIDASGDIEEADSNLIQQVDRNLEDCMPLVENWEQVNQIDGRLTVEQIRAGVGEDFQPDGTIDELVRVAGLDRTDARLRYFQAQYFIALLGDGDLGGDGANFLDPNFCDA